jgi:hypothetical protein
MYTLSVQNIRNTCSFHDIEWPGESRWMTPYWLTVKSISISVDGGDKLKKDFLCLETIETWIVYVCVPYRGWIRKIFKRIWTAYSSRCQAHRFGCVKNCNAVGFFMLNSFLCVSRMVHHLKDFQPTLQSNRWATVSQLTVQYNICTQGPIKECTTSHTWVGSIGVNMGQYPCGTLLTPCRVNVLYTQCMCGVQRWGSHSKIMLDTIIAHRVSPCNFLCDLLSTFLLLKLFRLTITKRLVVIVVVINSYWLKTCQVFNFN